jgi:hypothetical protein
MSSTSVEAPGFSPAKQIGTSNGFSHGWARAKARFLMQACGTAESQEYSLDTNSCHDRPAVTGL